ncbi:hypothetical protein CIW52_33040 [Mycolicibacterium sp. P9-64]|uniref:hypothetical protein n=1 Tax=Mycolicibacterium sp. P9-64 TaxID=2024612 RepID=UPI0011EE7B21|nr:hypothetical protein [Mycolicibacterium sp. P9-64]KAA0075612.1 hypothetical protein CIW52_33040 [Mycolicibacterium sp. P9-64]
MDAEVAAVGLVGDQAHVVTGTTTDLFSADFTSASAVPLIWSSPLWFTALLGELNARPRGTR